MGDEWGDEFAGESDDFREASGDFESEANAKANRRGRPFLEPGERAASPVRKLSAVEVRAQAKAAKLDADGEAALQLLFRYRVLRGEHIRQLVYPGLSDRTSERKGYTLLAGLRRWGFVARVGMPEGGPAYVLDEFGRAWIRHREGLRSEPRDQVAILGTRGSKALHDVLIGDFMIPLKRDIEGLGGEVTWLCGLDIPDREGYLYVMPDAYLDIELAGEHRRYFLEVDRGTEQLAQFATKVERYAEYRSHGDWRLLGAGNFPAVLTVTTGTTDNADGEKRMRNMREAALHRAKFRDHNNRNLPTWFFTTFTRIKESKAHNPLEAFIWTKAQDDGGHYALLTYSKLADAAIANWQAAYKLLGETTNPAFLPGLRGECERLRKLHERLKERAGGGQGQENAGDSYSDWKSGASEDTGIDELLYLGSHRPGMMRAQYTLRGPSLPARPISLRSKNICRRASPLMLGRSAASSFLSWAVVTSCPL